MKTIAIRCTAAVNLDLANLTPLQGELKELTGANFEKLKRSILKHGITFPFFIWQSEGENYILDGTQRDRVLKRMADEGYKIFAALTQLAIRYFVAPQFCGSALQFLVLDAGSFDAGHSWL